MELNGFERAIIAPEDDNATLKTLDEFKKYGQYTRCFPSRFANC